MNPFEITEQDVVATGQRLTVGIHKCNMLRPTFESLKEGQDPVLQLHFEDQDGRSNSEVIWNVDPAQVRKYAVENPRTHNRDNKANGYVKGEQITADEAVEIAYAEFRARLKHVATKFVDEETVMEATKGATSYEEFAEKYISIFTDEVLASGNPVWVKFPPNTQGYPTLAKYPPFIENAEEGKPTTLRFTNYEQQQIDKMNSANATDPEEAAFKTGEDPTDFDPSNFEDKAQF